MPNVRSTELGLVLVTAFMAILLMQARSGAWERELAFHPDESAHYVTGVMVSEYLRAGAREHPLRFAEQYYARYPRLALGHWPPLFSAVLGTWILAFGPERIAVFVLMALLGAAVAAALYRLARFESPAWVAAAVVAWWLLYQRQTQIWVSTVMTEIPFTLCCMAALIAYVLYMRDQHTGAAVLFGLAASAALLTKGLAVVLAFVPPLAVLAAGKPGLLRRWSFWLPAGIVLLVAGPWYALQGSLIPTAFGGAFDRLKLSHIVDIGGRFKYVLQLLGPVEIAVAVAALAGAILAARSRRRCSPLVAVSIAYLAGGLALHLTLPESAEPRHLYHLIPAFVALVAVAVSALLTQAPPWTARAGQVILIAAVAGRLAWPGEIVVKPDFGVVPLAKELAADPSLQGAAFMVAANGSAEGAFIAEAAQLAPDPHWFVLRSSKTLAWVNWAAHGQYITLYDNADDIAAYLDSIPVALVIVGLGQYQTLPHDQLLLEAIESNPQRWRLFTERTVEGRPYRVKVFRSTRKDILPQRPIQIDMRRRLGRIIEADPEPSLRARPR